jgi:hypothetical protein
MENVAEGDARNNGTYTEDGGPISDGLGDRFTVIIDQDAEPGDWDDALASFLLAYVRKRDAVPLGGKITPEMSA